MSIGQVFKDVLCYPFTDFKKFLKVFLMYLGFFLVIPVLMALGYSLRIIKSTILGFDDLPDFDDSSNLIEDGLKYVGANIIYNIPLYIVIGILVVITASDRLNLIMNSYSLLTITAIVGYLISIVSVPAVANMAYEDRFGAVFDFKRIFTVIKNMGWAKYLLYLLVYALIVEILTLAISSISPYLKLSMGSISGLAVYLLLSLLLNSYLIVIGGRFRGIIYSAGMGDELHTNAIVEQNNAE
ncbi:DUF4013 domain-containing protein [Methanobacterium petrolearium]|uniref:DUF4013 domain-containing protein n=1 Tax=Methanobacterium petrolearium TaxID=710190 RepID=UPI001AEA5501|nr:DUF4013 domain-containing protein [Methanobacterium petrolearium]MBP1944788.1 hypothetical protein [Methanobacterium petrolearium]BDZ70066.1 hypothetical protein GCM10025861_05830 [Methanobacterium petrolearium]